MARTLIVPGIDGSPPPHWQHWWAATRPGAEVIEQDDWSRPTPEAWESRVARAALRRPGAILVAHSVGCLVVARLLRTWPDLPIAGALLVAPADPSRNFRLQAFEAIPEGPLGAPVMVAASRNDPCIDFGRAAAWGRSWRADIVDLGYAGHVNVASGFGPWPEGLALYDELAQLIELQSPPPSVRLDSRRVGWAQ